MTDGTYARAHRRSIEDPEGFWGEAARGIDWITEPKKVLDDSQWENYSGLIGHYHVQENKQDPGPAFQWDKVIDGARALLRDRPAMASGR